VIADKYRVERVIAEGGMGAVIAARHADLGELRAIKIVLSAACRDRRVVKRFMQEARATVRLKSEHAVQIHDVGSLPSGEPYMVMEYLEGEDLARVLKNGGPLPVAQAADFVLQALEAVAEAHVAGIVHRDLKPANLFLTESADGLPSVKVLDFGISKLTGTLAVTADFEVTTSEVFLGSPHYMPPEQMRKAHSIDERADIWAVGVVLYRLLTGKLPFSGRAVADICAEVINGSPRPPTELRRDIPAGLEAVILRCLEKDREQRYPNVADLATALVPFGTEGSAQSAERIGRMMSVVPSDAAGQQAIEPVATAPLGPLATEPSPAEAPAGPSEGSVGTVSAWGQPGPATPKPKRALRLTMLAAVLGLGAIALVGVAAVVWRASKPPEPASASSPPVAASTDEASAAEPEPTATPAEPSAAEASPDAGAPPKPSASTAPTASATSQARATWQTGPQKPWPKPAKPQSDPFGKSRH